MASDKSHDHHFVPVFYLKKWIAGNQPKLVEYARRTHGPITPRWTGPKGTGYQPLLYDAQDDLDFSLEKAFFEPVDTQAALSMETFFRSRDGMEWTRPLRSSWSRFLMSMMMRHPQDLAVFRRTMSDDWTNLNEEMRQAYLSDRTPDQPETAEEWWEQNRAGFMEKAVMRILRTLMDHGNVGASLNSMMWSTADVSQSRYPLLTSDRPVLMHGHLADDDAFIMMPLSHDRLFIAVRQEATLDQIGAWDTEGLVAEINLEVVSRAERFVFASDTSQTDFIQQHFGQNRVQTLMEQLEVRRAADRAGLLGPRRVRR
jgi:hypothetical protein